MGPGRIEVGLYATFQQAPPAAVLEAAREELAGIVMPIGILVQWRSEADLASDPWWNRVATVEFVGRCDAAVLGVRPPHPWAFGQSQVSGGKVIPYAEIHCDALAAYLAPALVSNQRRSSAMFGRALGRVLAHELYHILTQTTRHGTVGIGKKSFSPADLTSDGFQFHGKEAQRLQMAIFAGGPPLCRENK